MNKLIIIFAAFIALLLYARGGTVENIGSDFFHRGKMAEVGNAIQKQLAKAQKLYKGQENFESGEYSINMTEEPLEKYNPNRNVISEYSFKAVEQNVKDPENVQVGGLEDDDFAQPIDYSNVKELADYLEVDKYNAGSGDMGKLNEAYGMLNKEQYFQSLKALRVRGGNVAIYDTKPCDPSRETDIVGYI
jgi:hypothetical protein